ncbi:hypothetical protein ACQXX2_03970 [Corynebacterium diphtheriae]|nr:hypothetical protein FRC0088_01985 [Corynebacterium diphtheriae]
MFKRSLASLAAVAVVSGAVVAPANAMTTTVNGDMCTITPTDEEARLTGLTQTKTLNIDKGRAANIKDTIAEPQLRALHMQIEKDQGKLANPRTDLAEKEKLRRELEEKKNTLTAYEKFRDALKACIAGESYDSSKPGGPKNPDDSSKPGGPKNPDDSSKPGGPKNPEGERALPSTNGAVIGAIVAVLGILAAALPVIKSILRALLP